METGPTQLELLLPSEDRAGRIEQALARAVAANGLDRPGNAAIVSLAFAQARALDVAEAQRNIVAIAQGLGRSYLETLNRLGISDPPRRVEAVTGPMEASDPFAVDDDIPATQPVTISE